MKPLDKIVLYVLISNYFSFQLYYNPELHIYFSSIELLRRYAFVKD